MDTQTILTIHNNVITRNPRISLSRPTAQRWHLHIQRVQVREKLCNLFNLTAPLLNDRSIDASSRKIVCL